MPHLISILGQTATGKSTLATQLANHLINQGKTAILVNCDSRQIYKGLDLGAGKEMGFWAIDSQTGLKAYISQGVANYLIDFIELERYYNLSNYIAAWIGLFQNPAITALDYVILVGGTGLWAKAVIEELDLPQIKPEYSTSFDTLKAELDKLPLLDLQDKLAPSTAESLSRSEINNPRRLVNYLAKQQSEQQNWYQPNNYQYPVFESKHTFWLQIDEKTLRENIQKRITSRIDSGMLVEIKCVYSQYGGKRLIDLGLEYGLGVKMIEQNWTNQKYADELASQTWQYARRQRIWLQKQVNIIPIIQIQDIIDRI
ncbi:MAG: hypothetical protein H7230_03145 [Candidatus Parcubacteria bacterium]|nr:hypothetical protein [Candidatus Paceibacterota bacterium]